MCNNIINLSMLVLWMAFLALAASSPCQRHLTELSALYLLNKAKFAQAVHGYVLYSGKMNDDLGLPSSCNKYQQYQYFTGVARASNDTVMYRAYLGVCFSSKCTQQDLNDNTAFIVNKVLNITKITQMDMTFVKPNLQNQVSSGAIVVLVLFLLLLLVSIKETVLSFCRKCRKEAHKEDQELYGKYAIQFSNSNATQEDYDPTLLSIEQHEGFFKKMCIFSKMGTYLSREESTKIISFSAFRILAVVWAYYGYLFYLCNLGAYNYNALDDQIYSTRWAKLALASYYIPDTLFFISGFLLARKAHTLFQIQSRPSRAFSKLIFSKLSRLVPLYWAFILIYWQISPALHSGPVWSQYQNQAAVCDSQWWKVLLLLDNWGQQSCYDWGWFVPAQVQMSLIAGLLVWLQHKNKQTGMAILILLTLASLVITLVLSAPFPHSYQTILDSYSIYYFKSTYAHLPYYLFGVLNGYLSYGEHTKHTMTNLTKNIYLRILGIIVSIVLISLIIIHPSMWEHQLGFQLGLAKMGMFIGVYLLMFWTMFADNRMRITGIHRFSALMKGTMLLGGIVVGSYFWGSYTFPYLDSPYLTNTTLANLLIAIPVGALLLALLTPKPNKEEQILL